MNYLAKNILRMAILFVLIILTMMIFAIGNTLKAQSFDSWKLVVYVDTRTNDSERRSVLQSITENTPDYLFILNVGDAVEDGNSDGDSTSATLNVTVEEEGDGAVSLTFPLRGAFYYPWFPETWTVGGEHVSYNVELGYYSSDDIEVVDQHIRDMDYAKIDVAIASWWRISGHNQANRFPMLLNQTVAAGSDLKWAIYYEMEGFSDPSIEDLKSDLAYLMENYTNHEAYARIDGKPVIFVYNANDGSCDVTERWAEATNGEWYVNLKVYGGFRDCADQPDSWHQYGPGSPAQQHNGYSYVISPGFWRADQESPLLARDVNRWNQNVRDMAASGEPWQLITTFNEWGEGTAIERCLDWTGDSEYGLYLDALHNDGETFNPTPIERSEDLPAEFELAQNYPNPFNPSTNISYEIAERTQVAIKVYDVLGKLVAPLVDDIKEAGSHNAIFDASNLPSGIYIVQMQAGNYMGLKKMMLVK